MEDSLLDAARAYAEIDTAALIHNFRAICTHCGGRTICVVKANAYGHGFCLAIPALCRAGCDFFAVACLEEALAVRTLAPTADILILGYTPARYADLLAHHAITQTVFSAPYAAELSMAAATAGVSVRAHLKIDTGMCRLGFSPTDTEGISFALRAENLQPWGAFTHFPCADTDPVGTRRALRDFLALRDLLPKGFFLHAAASAAALTLPQSILNGARVGLALYGFPPIKASVHLIPALQLFSTVTQIKCIPAGTPVGYGGSFVTVRPSRIGTIPIGYADGLTRSLEGMTVRVFCRNGVFSAPLVGHICMDQAMLDLTDIKHARQGDRVCVFSDICTVAKHRGTIPYEVLTAISPRVERRKKEQDI